MAQRSESRAKLAWAMPSKQAILKQSFIRSSGAAVDGWWLMVDGWWMMGNTPSAPFLYNESSKISWHWQRWGLRRLFFSSPLLRKVAIYLYEKSVRNSQKVKYPRIFNEIITDTWWNIRGYVMKYSRIFEEFGMAGGIIYPIGQTFGMFLAIFFVH